MNFLAHCHLGDITNSSIVANLSGDFIRGPIKNAPNALHLGLYLHRQIDAFTDRHPDVTVAKLRLAHHRRVSAILIDLWFDHLLAKHWSSYHHQPLGQFSRRCYQLIEANPFTPDKLMQILPSMAQGDWLSAYQHLTGIEKAITGVANRFSKPHHFEGGFDALLQQSDALEQDFARFYPKLCRHIIGLSRQIDPATIPLR